MNDKRILIIGTAAAAALLIGGALWLNRGNGGNDQFAQCRAGVVAGRIGAQRRPGQRPGDVELQIDMAQEQARRRLAGAQAQIAADGGAPRIVVVAKAVLAPVLEMEQSVDDLAIDAVTSR